MTIGDVRIDGPLVLGPMAGFSHLPLRILCRRAGAHLVCSEMVAVEGLVRDNKKSFSLLRSHPSERPVSMQIFGAEPQSMAAAVPHLEAAGADIVDINMGCPVPKVLKARGGSALMRDPDRAVAIVTAVVKAARVPVTCKIRAGSHEGDESYLELGVRLQEAGAAAVAVHARTITQGFSGEADHRLTGRLVEALRIPVIASGDVFTPTMPLAILQDTGCAGVMIARGAVGRPWVFLQANEVLAGRRPPPDPPTPFRLGVALCQAQMLQQQSDEHTAVHQMRAHLAWYSKGLPGGAGLRRECNKARTLEDLRQLVEEFARTEWTAGE